MRFEEQVRLLCAQAFASREEEEVRTILAELRLILHPHIEHLRRGLHSNVSPTVHLGITERWSPLRTWHGIVQDFRIELDPGKGLQLSEI